MKDFLILNIEEDITRYFTAKNIPEAKAKSRQLGWRDEKTVVCSNIGNFYEPTLNVDACRLRIFDAKKHIDAYMIRYVHAISHLPVNFLYSGRLRKT